MHLPRPFARFFAMASARLSEEEIWELLFVLSPMKEDHPTPFEDEAGAVCGHPAL